MKTFPFVWQDADLAMPESSNAVLVLTKQGKLAIASYLPDMIDWGWSGDCTWNIHIGISRYEVWDNEKHGEIAFWAEIPMDSSILNYTEKAE